MLNEWNKCNFCRKNENGTCRAQFCHAQSHYILDKNKIVSKAKELGISVVDVITLINL